MNQAFSMQDIVGRSELMERSRTGTNGIIIHQPQTGGGLDSVKEWLDKESIGDIKNKWLVAGVALAGLAYYGHTQRWF